MAEAVRHVTFYVYDHVRKIHQRYDALVIGSHEAEDHDYPLLNLIHFRHLDTASHHALSGVDWADTLERTLDVPHEDDKVNQSFYYVESDEDALRSELYRAHDRLDTLTGECMKLKAELALTTEGKDAELQQLADAMARKPSGADLDAHVAQQAAEQAAKNATGGESTQAG